MDGGGSTTMAWWNPTDKASELLNVPVGYGAYQTNTERCDGNSIGVYYVAAEPSERGDVGCSGGDCDVVCFAAGSPAGEVVRDLSGRRFLCSVRDNFSECFWGP